MADPDSNQKAYIPESWKNFEATGSISDYLLYCNIHGEETPPPLVEG